MKKIVFVYVYYLFSLYDLYKPNKPNKPKNFITKQEKTNFMLQKQNRQKRLCGKRLSCKQTVGFFFYAVQTRISHFKTRKYNMW